MNDVTFYIVDDDRACRTMLTEIIEEENLGEVIGFGSDGKGQDISVFQARPDILLVDLLMPEVDGINLVKNLRSRGFEGGIIMISQVENKNLVAEAYREGIEFYITKPINRVEVVSVIKQMVFSLLMQKSLNQVQNHISLLPKHRQKTMEMSSDSTHIRKNLMYIFSDLGIIGETGVNDILEVVLFLLNEEKWMEDSPNLRDLYNEVLISIKKDSVNSDIKAMEQRIRRAIRQAMENVAAIGLADYHDPRFDRYAAMLFDFNEVRIRMEELKKNKKNTRTRINIKKFLQALMMETSNF